MPCFYPLHGYRAKRINPKTKKRAIVFKVHDGFVDMPVIVACGRCSGCRLERSRQWAIRCMHESSLHEFNSFITLTYAPKHLPPGGTLVLKHWQQFMYRLRKKYGKGIRFFHCGEYGEKLGRPHYHAILFGLDFADKTKWKMRRGYQTWRSKSLEKLWPFGHSEIGSVTFESAAYVARYILKKKQETRPASIITYSTRLSPVRSTRSRNTPQCLDAPASLLGGSKNSSPMSSLTTSSSCPGAPRCTGCDRHASMIINSRLHSPMTSVESSQPESVECSIRPKSVLIKGSTSVRRSRI